MHHNTFAKRTDYACSGGGFDGSTDYITRGAGLTNAADSGIFSFVTWIRIDGGNGALGRIYVGSSTLAGAADRFVFSKTATNRFNFTGTNAAGTAILNISSAGQYTAGATWRCVMACFDLSDAAKRFVFVGDTDDTGTVTTYTNDVLDLTLADWSIGAAPDGTNKLTASLAETHFYPGVYIDFSSVTNRRKFLSVSGYPVDTGATGSIPTGTAPIDLHKLGYGEIASNFALNRGTGGNFTATGTIATPSTTPSNWQ